MALARGGDLVVLRAAALGRLAPLPSDEPFLLEPVQRREERAGFDDERLPADLLDAIRDADAVLRLERQRLEDEKVERALDEFRLALRHGADYNTVLAVRYRQSISSTGVQSRHA